MQQQLPVHKSSSISNKNGMPVRAARHPQGCSIAMIKSMAYLLMMLTERQAKLSHVVCILAAQFVCNHVFVGPVEHTVFITLIGELPCAASAWHAPWLVTEHSACSASEMT